MESNSYCEVLVKVKPAKVERVFQNVFWVLSAVYLALGLIYIIFLVPFIIFLILSLVWKRKLSQEYEYQYLDGDLRIDRIISMRKRKKAARYDIDNLCLMAPEGDERLQPWLKRNDGKKLDFSAHDPDSPNRYVLVFQAGGVQCVTLDPSREMVQIMWRAAPSKVIRKPASTEELYRQN